MLNYILYDLLINKINGLHGFKLKIDKMFYLIHNGEKVPGMILSILPGDQIKRHSKWIKHFHMPVAVGNYCTLSIYNYSIEYRSLVLYKGSKEECLARLKKFPNIYPDYEIQLTDVNFETNQPIVGCTYVKLSAIRLLHSKQFKSRQHIRINSVISAIFAVRNMHVNGLYNRILCVDKIRILYPIQIFKTDSESAENFASNCVFEIFFNQKFLLLMLEVSK